MGTMTEARVLSMRMSLDGHDEVVFVAVEEGEMIGMVKMTNLHCAAATLFQLFVADGARGRGVGAALVEEACGMARESGAEAASVLVERDGPGAWWRRRGFEPVHCEGERVLMSKRLAAGRVKRDESERYG